MRLPLLLLVLRVLDWLLQRRLTPCLMQTMREMAAAREAAGVSAR